MQLKWGWSELFIIQAMLFDFHFILLYILLKYSSAQTSNVLGKVLLLKGANILIASLKIAIRQSLNKFSSLKILCIKLVSAKDMIFPLVINEDNSLYTGISSWSWVFSRIFSIFAENFHPNQFRDQNSIGRYCLCPGHIWKSWGDLQRAHSMVHWIDQGSANQQGQGPCQSCYHQVCSAWKNRSFFENCL